MLFTTLARTTVRAAAPAARLRTAPRAPHLCRAFAASALVRKDPGEGVKGTEKVGEENPVSARAKGVANAAKTAVDGAIGMGQAATGEQSSLGTDKKHPGPDSRTHIEAEEEKGRKEGLAHKGEQQGAI
ncbi:hypothetical protein JCM9279_000443 [Rhodotorula babjevae]